MEVDGSFLHSHSFARNSLERQFDLIDVDQNRHDKQLLARVILFLNLSNSFYVFLSQRFCFFVNDYFVSFGQVKVENLIEQKSKVNPRALIRLLMDLHNNWRSCHFSLNKWNKISAGIINLRWNQFMIIDNFIQALIGKTIGLANSFLTERLKVKFHYYDLFNKCLNRRICIHSVL